MKRHLSYANVAATLALVFAMTGGAVAASHSYLITGINQIKPSVREQLRSDVGPAGKDGLAGGLGLQGPKGPEGKQGPEGVPGQTGATGATGATGPAGRKVVPFAVTGAPVAVPAAVKPNEPLVPASVECPGLARVTGPLKATTAHVVVERVTPEDFVITYEAERGATATTLTPGAICVNEKE